nr:MAG TPA: hypothetical protein [Bacteriophage sp.]
MKKSALDDLVWGAFLLLATVFQYVIILFVRLRGAKNVNLESARSSCV